LRKIFTNYQCKLTLSPLTFASMSLVIIYNSMYICNKTYRILSMFHCLSEFSEVTDSDIHFFLSLVKILGHSSISSKFFNIYEIFSIYRFAAFFRNLPRWKIHKWCLLQLSCKCIYLAVYESMKATETWKHLRTSH